jgi:hypothetical protein
MDAIISALVFAYDHAGSIAALVATYAAGLQTPMRFGQARAWLAKKLCPARSSSVVASVLALAWRSS